MYVAWRIGAARTEEATGHLETLLARPVTLVPGGIERRRATKAETSAPGVGALRLRLVATKGRDESMTLRGADQKYADGVLLDLDYWALVPR